MNGRSYDVVVVGLGAMGSAALWQLARRGFRACGIDQFAPPHTQGSSHGQTRAIRKAYFEHPDYVPLLHRAYEGWGDLEAESGAALMRLCGMLFAGYRASEAIQGLERCYAAHDLPHERWTAEDAQRRFPQFRLEPEHVAFWDPHGGYLRAEASVGQCLRLARERGAALMLNESVDAWRAAPSACEVQTRHGVIHAGAIIFTAGPWTARVLRDLKVPVTILRKVQLWYSGVGIEAFKEDFPVWYVDNAYGGVYGFPALGEEGMKVAEHTGGEEAASPEEVNRDLSPSDEPPVLACLAKTFPSLTPRRISHEVCMYTVTPDRNFILDRHPHHSNVVIGAGFSGHGFKFAPVVGEILVDLATQGLTAHSVSFLGLDRFR